jgi:hypothetical protein
MRATRKKTGRLRSERPHWLLACTVLALAGCLGRAGQPATEVYSNPNMSGTEFQTFGLVAGDASAPGRSVAARTRERLETAGFTVLRNPGNWSSEEQALFELCNDTDTPAHGVVFVWWNRLVLRSCRPGFPRAYEARTTYTGGIDELLDSFESYLAPDVSRAPDP